MTVVFISGGLTLVVGLLIMRPFSVTGGRMHVRSHTPDDDRRRELLRQLRDLDDDLAAGKLTQADHIRLRDPVEREAAAVLGHKTQGPAGGTAVVTSGLPRGRDAGAGARRRHRRTVTLLALAGAAGIIMFLFEGAVSSRLPGRRSRATRWPGRPRWRRARVPLPRRVNPAARRPPARRPPASSWPRSLRPRPG